MSKTTENRHKMKLEYFGVLKDTADKVDPYILDYIENNTKNSPKLKQSIIQRYRFGKPQLRPAQVRLAYEIVGGKNWEEIIPACAAVEVKDTGYYCYDDVFDLGKDISLTLLGGTLISMSYAMMNDLAKNGSSKMLKEVIDEFWKLDLNNVQGAMIDLRLKEPNEQMYLEKAKKYNFWEHALKIGAILGGGNSKQVENLGIIGRNIGIAYIITNDAWDFGKDLEDFRNGKYTMPVIYALEKAEGEDKIVLNSLMNKKRLIEEEKNRIREIIVKKGVIEYSKKRANEFCDVARKGLEAFPDCKAKDMIDFSMTMTQRNKYYDFLKKFK